MPCPPRLCHRYLLSAPKEENNEVYIPDATHVIYISKGPGMFSYCRVTLPIFHKSLVLKIATI